MRKAADILKEMEALIAHADHEKRELTTDEVAQFDNLKAELAEAQAAESAAAEAQASATAERRAAVAAAREEQNRIAVAVPARTGVRAPGAPAVREFESFGHFVATVRFNPNDQRLASLWNPNAGDGLSAEQRMDDAQTGGFMVPTQHREELLRVSPQEAIVRPRATVIPAGTPPDAAISMPALDQRTAVGTNNVFSGMTFGKMAEGGVKPNTGFALREVTLQPQEWAGMIAVTDKLLRNWSAAGAMISELFRTAGAAYEDFQFFRGNGVGGPKGVLSQGARKVVNKTTAGHFTFLDYAAMISAMLPGGNYVWTIALDLRQDVITMRNRGGSPDGDGALVWAPAAVAGQPETLGGFPIIWYTRAPAATAEGAVALLDLKYYLIKDGSGPFIASSEHVDFGSNKTWFKYFGNHDGNGWLTEPFRTEGGVTVSPFVLLGAG